MKLYSTCKKLPLIALLSLGLVCSPLVASAGDSDRGRHGQYQQDRGKPQYKADHRRDHRAGHRGSHENRHSYRKGYKHGYKDRRHHHKRRGHHGYRHDSHRRHGHGHGRHYGHNYRHHHAHYRDDVNFMLGLYSENLDVIFRD